MRNYRARPYRVTTAREPEAKLKKTRIEVISVRCRVVSSSESEPRRRDHTDIDVLLSALGDIVSPAEQLGNEINEGGVEILSPSLPAPKNKTLAHAGVLLTHVQNKKE